MDESTLFTPRQSSWWCYLVAGRTMTASAARACLLVTSLIFCSFSLVLASEPSLWTQSACIQTSVPAGCVTTAVSTRERYFPPDGILHIAISVSCHPESYMSGEVQLLFTDLSMPNERSQRVTGNLVSDGGVVRTGLHIGAPEPGSNLWTLTLVNSSSGAVIDSLLLCIDSVPGQWEAELQRVSDGWQHAHAGFIPNREVYTHVRALQQWQQSTADGGKGNHHEWPQWLNAPPSTSWNFTERQLKQLRQSPYGFRPINVLWVRVHGVEACTVPRQYCFATGWSDFQLLSHKGFELFDPLWSCTLLATTARIRVLTCPCDECVCAGGRLCEL